MSFNQMLEHGALGEGFAARIDDWSARVRVFQSPDRFNRLGWFLLLNNRDLLCRCNIVPPVEERRQFNGGQCLQGLFPAFRLSKASAHAQKSATMRSNFQPQGFVHF